MATLLNRYLAGECIAVWRELAALGEQVRHRRHCDDAMAVARETMRRARSNIELLIQRLDAMGYRFMTMEAHERCMKDASRRIFAIVAEISEKMDPGDKRRFDRLVIRRLPEYQKLLNERADKARQAAIDYLNATLGAAKPPLKDHGVFLPPDKQTAKDLDRLEKSAGGPLPRSLRAWYEEVGAVSLLGWHSSLSPNPDEPNAGVCPDPLMIEPLKSVIRQWGEEQLDEKGYVSLAPDDVTKAGAGGCGPYSMRIPNRCADGIFAVAGLRKGPSFLNYLRNVFQWGGFPGWEGRKGCPKKIIAELAEGLLSI